MQLYELEARLKRMREQGADCYTEVKLVELNDKGSEMHLSAEEILSVTQGVVFGSGGKREIHIASRVRRD